MNTNMNTNEIHTALNEAEANLRNANDHVRRVMNMFVKHRLRSIGVDREVLRAMNLRAMKRELNNFNACTLCWKD